MNQKTKIFIAVAVPVVIILIGGVIVIALSLATCPAGKLCVVLNGKNETTSKKVYKAGLHMISPAYHFSLGLPAPEASAVGGVQTANESIVTETVNKTVDLGVFVVFKFYIPEENVFSFYDTLENNYSSGDYDVATYVQSVATPVVTEILGSYNCTEYREIQDEDVWIARYAADLKRRFEEEKFLFKLDAKKPVKAVFLFSDVGNCGRSST